MIILKQNNERKLMIFDTFTSNSMREFTQKSTESFYSKFVWHHYILETFQINSGAI